MSNFLMLNLSYHITFWQRFNTWNITNMHKDVFLYNWTRTLRTLRKPEHSEHVLSDSWWMTNVTHNFSMYLFIFLTLYMFRAHRAHHQERRIVSIQSLVAVTLCRWPCRVQIGSSLPTFTRHCHWHRMTSTRGCIDTIFLSWWWARCARNM